MIRAIVGIGANLGDRLGTMRAAVQQMRKLMKVERLSRVYETAPIGPPQPDYLNAAALVAYEGSAEDLLDALGGIEAQLGRARKEKWAPRTIDLDILWIEGLAIETERLTVPHPHLTARAFALRPLADVAPHALDPETGRPYAELTGEGAVRVTDLELYGAS
jgi:2-amino-4-hydroxy-6-hydroxymethyldihydropteridine diphosphokinase